MGMAWGSKRWGHAFGQNQDLEPGPSNLRVCGLSVIMGSLHPSSPSPASPAKHSSWHTDAFNMALKCGHLRVGTKLGYGSMLPTKCTLRKCLWNEWVNVVNNTLDSSEFRLWRQGATSSKSPELSLERRSLLDSSFCVQVAWRFLSCNAKPFFH